MMAKPMKITLSNDPVFNDRDYSTSTRINRSFQPVACNLQIYLPRCDDRRYRYSQSVGGDHKDKNMFDFKGAKKFCQALFDVTSKLR